MGEAHGNGSGLNYHRQSNKPQKSLVSLMRTCGTRLSEMWTREAKNSEACGKTVGPSCQKRHVTLQSNLELLVQVHGTKAIQRLHGKKSGLVRLRMSRQLRWRNGSWRIARG